MARFESSVMARVSLARAVILLRDELPQLAKHLPDISRIELIEKSLLPEGDVEITSVWHASPRIPPPFARLLDAQMLAWTDRARWTAEGTRCRFLIEPHFMRNSVQCHGQTVLESAMSGRGTRISFVGELGIKRVGTLASMVGGGLVDEVERFVAGLIGANLGKLGTALSLRAAEVSPSR
jgi:hypothetical protein